MEPVQEGLYAIYHSYALKGDIANPKVLAHRVAYLATGLSLLVPLVNIVVFHIFTFIWTSYHETLREAVDKGDKEKVKTYLDLGVSPNNIYDSVPLLFRTKDPEIIDALLKAGADRYRLNYDKKSFFEYLIEINRKDLAEKYFVPPFSEIAALQDERALKGYIQLYTFEKFYQDYLSLKKASPKVPTSWIWNVLYEIPSSHFKQFIPIQKKNEITKPPSVRYNPRELLGLYNRVNFTQKKEPHFIEESALVDTLDAYRKTYTPEELSQGLFNIIQVVTGGNHVYRITPKEREGYLLKVQWIVYYMNQDLGKEEEPLCRMKANILIEMAKSALNCPGRYNDIFDNALKRLKGEKIEVLSFNDQIQQHFADLRSIIVNQVTFAVAEGDTHSEENLIFHLHKSRALQETPPKGIFSSQFFDPTLPEVYKFLYRSEAKESFDKAYTPEAMMEYLLELIRSRPKGKKEQQEANDFDLLVMQAMIDKLASQHPSIKALGEEVTARGETSVFPLEEVEELFRKCDPEFGLPKDEATQQTTLGAHFNAFKNQFIGSFIRPLNDDLFGYALPEVIHPLLMGEFLVKLGHLRQRITFGGAV